MEDTYYSETNRINTQWALFSPYVLLPLRVIIALRGRNFYFYLHFTDVETEAWRNEETSPQLCSWLLKEPRSWPTETHVKSVVLNLSAHSHFMRSFGKISISEPSVFLISRLLKNKQTCPINWMYIQCWIQFARPSLLIARIYPLQKVMYHSIQRTRNAWWSFLRRLHLRSQECPVITSDPPSSDFTTEGWFPGSIC